MTTEDLCAYITQPETKKTKKKQKKKRAKDANNAAEGGNREESEE